MENDNNNISQIDELQEKYNILKRKFDAQQIVNSNLVREVAQGKMSKMRNKQRMNLYWSIVIGVFCWVWATFYEEFSFAFCMVLLVLLVYNNVRFAVRMRKVMRVTTTTEDLLEAARSCKDYYNVSSRYRMIAIPTGVAFLVWFLLEMQHIPLAELTWQNIDKTTLFILAFTFVFSFFSTRKQKAKDTASCDEIINSLTQEE